MKFFKFFRVLVCFLGLFLTVLLSAQENTAATCSDGIDNDGDGLIDAIDPDCFNAGFAPRIGCSDKGFLVQSATSEWYLVNLITGAYDTGTENMLFEFNAIGYNQKDERIWGYVSGLDTLATPNDGGQLFVMGIDAAGNIQVDTTPTIPPLIDGNFFVGDIDSNGVGYFMNGNKANNKYMYTVDLDPNSTTYLAVDSVGPFDHLKLNADMAFHPNNGFIYTMANNEHIFRIDPSNGDEVDLGHSNVSRNGNYWGAAYFDVAGYFYASENSSGEIFRIDSRAFDGTETTIDTATTILFAYGPSSNKNDGARCPKASVNVDLGDAPDSYKTNFNSNGARHAIDGYSNMTSTLYMGSSIDADEDGNPSASANGDGADEDGIPSTASFVARQDIVGDPTDSTTITIDVHGTEANMAYLSIWVDLNIDGSFDSTEQVVVDYPTTSGSNQVKFVLQMDSVDFISGVATTYLRARLSTDANLSFDGAASDGEVEDYQIMVDLLEALNAEQVNFEAVVYHDDVQLSWNHDAAMHVSSYVLEYAINDATFEKLDIINDANVLGASTALKYTHESVGKLGNVTISYRLKSIGVDGTVAYSNIQQIILEQNEANYKVLPTDVRIGETIFISGPKINSVEVLSLDGRMVKNYQELANTQFELETADLISSMYIIRINKEAVHRVFVR